MKWNKKEGDKVKAGEEIAEVETDKATMPMEAFEGGTLAVIVVKEGEKVAVGSLLGVIATSEEKIEDVKKQYAGEQKAGQAAAPNAKKSAGAAGGDVPPPAPEGGSVATMEGASGGQLQEPQSVDHGAPRSSQDRPLRRDARGQRPDEQSDRIKASPLARRIADDRGSISRR